MKEQIDKLTEKQAKHLLTLAMIFLRDSVYADKPSDRMKSAENLGRIIKQIETLSNEK
jgi:hypothetical protein